MNGAHLHLLINHIPGIGLVVGVLILVYGTVRRKPDVVDVGLWVFVVTALVSVAVYLTGEPAEEIVEHMADVSHDMIEVHEEAAIFALISTSILGLLSIAGLATRRRGTPRWLAVLTIVVAFWAASVLVRVSYLGGQVHHPEARSSFTPVPEEVHGPMP
ncbi:MAG TPA: hypothetical protein VFG50_06670 [Rhodothermales bacterium]|nr:hypothetical protein [Rhodothermales bacterium]